MLEILLWTLEIPVYDFVIMKISHSRCNLLCPFDQTLRWDLVQTILEVVVEWSIGTVLHDDAITWRLGTNSLELDDKDYYMVKCISQTRQFGEVFS